MNKIASRTLSVLAAGAAFFTATGCANDAGNGALIGGGVGALAGGIIGNQSGHAVGGALIGGAVGAGTGALIGHASDENKLDKQRQYDKGYYDAQRDTQRAPAARSNYSSSRTTVTTTESYYR